MTDKEDMILGSIRELATSEEKLKHNTTININRASTDESINLFREMQKTARENIIDKIELTGNGFESKVFVEHDMDSWKFIAVAIVDLNGRRLVVEADVDAASQESYPKQRTLLLRRLIENMSAKIALEVLWPAWAKEME